MRPDDLTYDPVSEHLDVLCKRMDRAENEMRSAGRSAPQQGLTRKWWEAYLTYHIARIETDSADHIPCPECEGHGDERRPDHLPPAPKGIMARFDDGVEIDCGECEGTGKLYCCACGENPATVTNEDFDPLCAECAKEV
ncbi:MAG: hypothetical protein NUW01_16750 [Gemmatimonadaceae bacterium]|nr:hypothetical protein [Gemmatimonadaceae bacterium]